MLAGLIFGIATCALWGLTFVAPRAVEPFTPADLAVARYGLFGLAAVLALAHPRLRRALAAIVPAQKALGFFLGAAGYLGYFLAVAFAVKAGGAVIPPLITGLMPVILPLIAERRQRTLGFARLALPLGLIGLGILGVQLSALLDLGAVRPPAPFLGLAFSVLALAIWIVYGLANAMVLSGTAPPDTLAWTCLQGIGAAFGALLLLPWTSFPGPVEASSAELWRFLLWSLMMGLGGSFAATAFWAAAARRLPLSLAAQLIVAETIFGMIYGLIHEMRMPGPSEAVGAACQIAGVCLGVARFARAAARPPVTTPTRQE